MEIFSFFPRAFAQFFSFSLPACGNQKGKKKKYRLSFKAVRSSPMSSASMSGRVFLLREIGHADLLHKLRQFGQAFLAGPKKCYKASQRGSNRPSTRNQHVVDSSIFSTPELIIAIKNSGYHKGYISGGFRAAREVWDLQVQYSYFFLD